jgi:hypothetical protein
MPNLFNYVFWHLCPDVHEPSLQDISHICLKDHKLKFHVTARFNYTAYDIRRKQDFINVNTSKAFVMVSTPGAYPHPWRYACVVKILHVDGYISPESINSATHINMLWVRWLETDPDWQFGAGILRPERLRWCSDNFATSFGFVNPSTVIQAAPINPAMNYGVTAQPHSPLGYCDTPDGDYKYHYVGRYTYLLHVCRVRTDLYPAFMTGTFLLVSLESVLGACSTWLQR